MLLGARLAGCHSFARSFAATFSIVIAACKWENCVFTVLSTNTLAAQLMPNFQLDLQRHSYPFQSSVCFQSIMLELHRPSASQIEPQPQLSQDFTLQLFWSHLIWSAVCTCVNNLKFSKSNYSKFKWYTARTVSTDQLVSILQYITWMILYFLWSYYGWKQSKLHQTWSHFIVDILSCYIAYWDRQNECDKLQGK